MKNIKSLGICMDHASAHLIEFTADPAATKTVESQFSHQEKEDSIRKSESLMHNKEQHEQHEFYKKLADVIRHYDSVLLFGATKAKVELHNLLKADHRFADIKIEIRDTDKMDDVHQHKFVHDYFVTQ